MVWYIKNTILYFTVLLFFCTMGLFIWTNMNGLIVGVIMGLFASVLIGEYRVRREGRPKSDSRAV